MTREDPFVVSVVGGDGRRLLGASVHLFFVLRENFTSVSLCFLRGIRVCERAIRLEMTGNEI